MEQDDQSSLSIVRNKRPDKKDVIRKAVQLNYSARVVPIAYSELKVRGREAPKPTIKSESYALRLLQKYKPRKLRLLLANDDAF